MIHLQAITKLEVPGYLVADQLIAIIGIEFVTSYLTCSKLLILELGLSVI